MLFKASRLLRVSCADPHGRKATCARVFNHLFDTVRCEFDPCCQLFTFAQKLQISRISSCDSHQTFQRCLASVLWHACSSMMLSPLRCVSKIKPTTTSDLKKWEICWLRRDFATMKLSCFESKSVPNLLDFYVCAGRIHAQTLSGQCVRYQNFHKQVLRCKRIFCNLKYISCRLFSCTITQIHSSG